MKIYFYAILFALVLQGCFSHDPPVSKELIFQSPLYVKFGDSAKVEATSIYPIQFTVLDNYYAELTQTNYIFGKRVGQTFISVESNGMEGKIRVEIMSKYGFFSDPVLDFTLDKDQLLQQLGIYRSNAYQKDSTNLMVYGYPDRSMFTRFAFKDGILHAVNVYTHVKNIMAVYQTIEERYQWETNSDGVRFYINKLTFSEAAMVIGVQHDYDTEMVMITYVPVHNASDQEKSLSKLKSLMLET